MKTASASIFFDSRRMKDEMFSVKISVYFNGKQKLVPTGFMLPSKDVNFLKKNKFGLSGRIKDDDQRNLWNMIYGDGQFNGVTLCNPFLGAHLSLMPQLQLPPSIPWQIGGWKKQLILV
jgi:hypothetical protein